MRTGLARRLAIALALLLLVFGGFVALTVRHAAQQHELEVQQRTSHGLARHIVEHWPQVSSGDAADAVAREELLRMLMVVNPGVQVYVLDAEGQVNAYIGEPGMVRTHQVDLQAVRSFLAGAALPLLGTDPMGSGAGRVFSAAMFAPKNGSTKPPGYLYVVLEGPARAAIADGVSLWPAWRGAAGSIALGLLATLAGGAWVFGRLSLPLKQLAARIGAFNPLPAANAPAVGELSAPPDEVRAIAHAFDAMSARVGEQVRARQAEARTHREAMANVAHDLRTPLTALHGQLEALDTAFAADDPQRRARLLSAALAQSDKVRRLTQQLFELATLQSTEQVVQRERFRLDELVTDTVQKFEQGSTLSAVTLVGQATGPVEWEGDLHLIERALSNLIDNAVRHAGGGAPVRVSLQCSGPQMTVLVEDSGPGLPAECARRLDAGQPVGEPPLPRPGGGIGGLGLAIAQRIAVLHGGKLLTLPSPGGGTRLALALPSQAPSAALPA
jgi:signal transduction histidine kinase